MLPLVMVRVSSALYPPPSGPSAYLPTLCLAPPDALTFFFANFGPNATTFIIPAEVITL